MTVFVTGALPQQAPNWQLINWDVVKSNVKRLQMRIAQAVNNRRTLLMRKGLTEGLSRMLGNSRLRF